VDKNKSSEIEKLKEELEELKRMEKKYAKPNTPNVYRDMI
jgi:hypothetical protein